MTLKSDKSFFFKAVLSEYRLRHRQLPRMSSSADWGRKIGVYAREQRQQCSDIDKDLQNQATSGQYGYDASDNSGKIICVLLVKVLI